MVKRVPPLRGTQQMNSRLAKVFCTPAEGKKTLAGYITLSRTPHPSFPGPTVPYKGNKVLPNRQAQLCFYSCPVLNINFPKVAMSFITAIPRFLFGSLGEITKILEKIEKRIAEENAKPEDERDQLALVLAILPSVAALIRMAGAEFDPPLTQASLSNLSHGELMELIVAIRYIIMGNPSFPSPGFIIVPGTGKIPKTLFSSATSDDPVACAIVGSYIDQGTVNLRAPLEPYNKIGGGRVLVTGPGTRDCECNCDVTWRFEPQRARSGDGCVGLTTRSSGCKIELVGSRGAPVILPTTFIPGDITEQIPSYPSIVLKAGKCRT